MNFWDLLGRIQWQADVEDNRAQESWLNFLGEQKQSFLMSRKVSKRRERSVWINREILNELKPQKEAHKKKNGGMDALGGM